MMAATGQLLVLFIILHVLGNSTIYFGWLNAYAAHLHALPPLLWSFRLVMIALFSLHLFFGTVLTLENSAARPQPYLVKKNLESTFAGRNMIWTGAVIGAFLIYHLLHFTFQITNPAIAAVRHPDSLGRPDVFLMVVRSFQNIGISTLYLIAVIALWLHLSHGIQSSVQTWGMNSDGSFPVVKGGSAAAAIILFIAYVAIPVVIVTGILKR